MGKKGRHASREAARIARELRDGCSPRQEEQLREIWARIPGISDCKGLCWDSCGPIRMTGVERALTERHGVRIPDRDARDGPAMCEGLTMLRRCALYEDRPTVCRLWGVMEHQLCAYGCEPDRLMSDEEGYRLLADVFEVAGQGQIAAGIRGAWDRDPDGMAGLLVEGRLIFDAEIAERRRVEARARAAGAAVLRVDGRGLGARE